MKRKWVIWITGGGTGIGKALALYWAEQGHQVVISGRRGERLESCVALSTNSSTPIVAIPCDVTDEKATQNVVQTILERFGHLDICVANAGFGVSSDFEYITPEQWRHQINVNLLGAIWTMQAALPALHASSGRLAVISSVSGKLAIAKTSAYSATKFALVGICNALYQELSGSGVSITDVLPGMVSTEIAQVDNDGSYAPHRKDRRPKQLLWTAEKAAVAIAKGIEARKREVVITGHGKLAVFLVNHFSGALYRLLAAVARRQA